MGRQHSYSATRDARADRIRAACQDDRDARTQYQAGTVGPRQEGELFGENVARFQVRHEQDVRVHEFGPGQGEQLPLAG